MALPERSYSASEMKDRPFSIGSFAAFVRTHTIHEVYGILGHDYAAETKFQESGETAPTRTEFIGRFHWLRPPESDDIKRLFNQTNTFYGEKWACENREAPAVEFLREENEFILFRQRKSLGCRIIDIGYGTRVELDFLDPRRHFNLLRGIAPRLLGPAIDIWCGAVNSAVRTSENALFLAMVLIAIHPFSDGNGRVARLAYTWLLHRWSLPIEWLAEAEDGEFLRVGHGTESTEYLMGEFVAVLCGSFNRIKFGFREWHTPDEEDCALACLHTRVRELANGGSCTDLAFVTLLGHFREHRHFRTVSPRFECLKGLIAN